MRQDYALRYEGTKVRDEYAPLMKLADRGLAVPRPLLLEARGIGARAAVYADGAVARRSRPALICSAFARPVPALFSSWRSVLALLHRAPPAELGLAACMQDARGRQFAVVDRGRIGSKMARKRDPRLAPDRLRVYLGARAMRQRIPGSLAVVHGDAGPYNLLVDGDRLSALLDWEFVHVGDPVR